MKHAKTLALGIIWLLIFSVTVASAIPKPETLAVPETSATIVVDGTLDMNSEWNGSAVIAWYNPLDGCELDRIYLLHNSTHYLIGGVLYDLDHKKDDKVTIYVNWDTNIYKYIIHEDSASATLCNNTSPLTTNATAILTKSTHSTHWIYLEMAVPKTEWGNSETVKMYFEHEHTYKLHVTSRYPENANSTDTSKWLTVEFRKTLGQYSVKLTFKDRDGNTIEYVAGESYAEISFLNGTAYTVIAPTGSSVEVLLPSENYTIVFYVYDIPIFNTTLNVNTNITATYTLNNLKYVTTAFGDIVAVVEIPGEIGCIYLDPEKHLGTLITNSTEEIALRIYPKVTWNYTFVTVLNALNFTYNPFTGNLLAYAPGNFSGIMMIGAPEDYPVFFFANGTVRGYVYNHELEELDAWTTNGTYMIYHIKTPFAVTLNNTALMRGADYSTDPFNVTTVSIGNGELRIYFRNPAKVSLDVADATAKITITSPYRFNGTYTLKILRNTETVSTKTGKFTSTVPLTIVEIPLGSLDSGTYTVEAIIVDEDSQKTLGTATETYSAEAAPKEEIPWENYLWFLIIAALAIATIIALKTSAKATVEQLEKKKKFVKKKNK